jgi:hypothetical protein
VGAYIEASSKPMRRRPQGRGGRHARKEERLARLAADRKVPKRLGLYDDTIAAVDLLQRMNAKLGADDYEGDGAAVDS